MVGGKTGGGRDPRVPPSENVVAPGQRPPGSKNETPGETKFNARSKKKGDDEKEKKKNLGSVRPAWTRSGNCQEGREKGDK